MLRQFLVRIKSRPKALVGLVFVALANQLSIVALAAGPSPALTLTGLVQTHRPPLTLCTRFVADFVEGCPAPGDDSFQVTVPEGAQPCPFSGEGASCSLPSPALSPGVPSTPEGQTPCAPESTASCSDAVLPPAETGAPPHGTAAVPVVLPSVPEASLQDPLPVRRLELIANSTTAVPGNNVLLTATASGSVTGSAVAIQIFDRTTGALAASCTQGSQCSVNYASKAGVHAFTAYVTRPTSNVPAPNSAVASNTVSVSWIGVTLSAKNAIVGPAQPVTLTATSTIPLDKSGLLLQLYDAHSKARLTYCGSGSTCSTSLTQSTGGARSVVAAIAKASPTLPASEGTVAQSNLISPTWLSLVIDAYMSSSAPGTPINVRARANADMTGTPWSIGIYNDQNQLIGAPCKSGTICTARSTFSGGAPKFSAAVGVVPTFDTATAVGQLLQRISSPTKLVDIQARSAAIPAQVTRVLWGVDSCKSFTSDPNGGNGLLPMVRARLGMPDFWGRYLTDTVCPGISEAEIEAARRNHMAILPIYNDYHCSNVVGYGAGRQYGAAATAAAAGLGIPQGHALVIDIEPPGDACPGAANVDAGFVQGWYDGVSAAMYVPAYYGDGTAGKEFGSAWCAAVASRPEIAENSYVWSFQPSLLGNFSKGNAPGFLPNITLCPEHWSGWQYVLSAGGDPDVDQDEVVNDLPLWYP